jgi:hypothetical protein
LTTDELADLRHAVSAEEQAVNRILQRTPGISAFIDLYAALCGPEYRCPIASPEGRLYSFDGTHLTRDGAVLLAHRLRAQDAFAPLSPDRVADGMEHPVDLPRPLAQLNTRRAPCCGR